MIQFYPKKLGKAPSDEMTLAALSVKTGMKIMMMGSSEQVFCLDIKKKDVTSIQKCIFN